VASGLCGCEAVGGPQPMPPWALAFYVKNEG